MREEGGRREENKVTDWQLAYISKVGCISFQEHVLLLVHCSYIVQSALQLQIHI